MTDELDKILGLNTSGEEGAGDNSSFMEVSQGSMASPKKGSEKKGAYKPRIFWMQTLAEKKLFPVSEGYKMTLESDTPDEDGSGPSTKTWKCSYETCEFSITSKDTRVLVGKGRHNHPAKVVKTVNKPAVGASVVTPGKRSAPSTPGTAPKRGPGRPSNPMYGAASTPRTTTYQDCIQQPEVFVPNRQTFKSDIPVSYSKPNDTRKRTDYLSWDDYFMSIAKLSSLRSKDPSDMRAGACIVNKDKRIVGVGYVGLPFGVNDDAVPWNDSGSYLDTKHAYVCHAEMNAILNKISSDLKGCTLYTATVPCNECAKLIIQAGIATVFYCDEYRFESDKITAARRLFSLAGVNLVKYSPDVSSVVISFT